MIGALTKRRLSVPELYAVLDVLLKLGTAVVRSVQPQSSGVGGGNGLDVVIGRGSMPGHLLPEGEG